MRTRENQSGFVIATLLGVIVITSILVATVTTRGIANYQSATLEDTRKNSQFAADAGLDVGLYELNRDADYTGGSEVTLLNTTDERTTYQITITEGSTDDHKIIRSTGRTYQPASATSPKTTRIFEIEVEAVTSGTSGAGVVSGVGGLYMNNNSKITGGDVIVGGVISMSNQSQIGLSSTSLANAVNVRVAHYDCPNPANASYPRACAINENGQPITMQNNARIYADVKANNQTTTTNITNPGLTANSGVDPTTVPSYNRDGQKAAVTVAKTYASTNAAVACPNNNGNVTWPADIKIVGDVNMGNNCTINVTGNVWITGRFRTGNQGRIVVSNALGTTRPVIMVDGTSGFTLENNGAVQPNNVGTGIELRTFWSNSGCTPECATVTGTNLKNSQNTVTIDLGNNGSASNSVFIAQWSRVRVSNNGVLGAISGQSIELSNQAVINFTASVPGSDNLTVTWVKRGYLRVFQ